MSESKYRSRVTALYAVLNALAAGLLIGRLAYSAQWGTWFESIGFCATAVVLNIVSSIGNAWSLVRSLEAERGTNKV